jgi:cytochrome c oxidase cbb3-type subunit 3
MSAFWSGWVILLTLGTVIGCLWLLQANSKRRVGAADKDTTGHVWDKDLREFNNPLPKWWLSLFWITGAFCFIYLAAYPGLGNFLGVFGWGQVKQYEAEMAEADRLFGNVYAALANIPLAELPANPEAVRLGRNLFLNRCATCHGSDGRGAKGYPNLADKVWLYGGAPETIEATITNGRAGAMPAWGPALGEQGVNEVVAYILSRSGRSSTSTADIGAGQQKFTLFCSACHGPEALGNPALGAPNLTDDDWLHGGAEADIRDVIVNGRVSQMPAQNDVLSPDRIRVLVAYVLSLGNEPGT